MRWIVRLVVLCLLLSSSVVLVPQRAALAVAPKGAWTPVAPLPTARSGHRAILLKDGRVVVVGGTGAISTTDIFDPATSTWTTAGSMLQGRASQTATLLNDGRILVAGGFASNMLSSAEIFDPATDTWSSTGPMNSTRRFHSATLLPDGRVLVAGGDQQQGAESVLASAELYDPVTGTWTLTGSMGAPRKAFSVTLLADGRVLASGGAAGSNPGLATAELYDPATGAWTATDDLIIGRSNHSAVRLHDGRVLVGGGRNSPSSLTATSETYNPATGTWSAVGNMKSAAIVRSMILLSDGRVLAAAGQDGDGVNIGSAELFDPETNTWSVTAALPNARASQQGTLLADGRALITGGSGSSSALTDNQIYDPFAKTTAITINDNAAASPYPSNLAISGVSGTIRKVTVTLRHLVHSKTNDLDVLLVGPGGQTVLLMSDVGGDNAFGGLLDEDNHLTFDQDAAHALPATTPINGRVFRPTNNRNIGDTFPAPAPAGPYGTSLDVFEGLSPNGTWKLFIVDDTAGSQIAVLSGGWSMSIVTDTMVPTVAALPSPLPNAAGWVKADGSVRLLALDEDTGSGIQSFTYSKTGAQTQPPETVDASSVLILINTEGTTTVTYRATDAAGNTSPDRTIDFKLDKTTPDIIQPVRVRLRVNAALTDTDALPVTAFDWLGSDPRLSASGLSRYTLTEITGSSSAQIVALPSPLATSQTRNVPNGISLQYTIRAIDLAENVSPVVSTGPLLTELHQESDAAIVDGGVWTTAAAASASGGALQFTGQAGRTATFTFSGTHVGWVAVVGPDRGKAEVRVDGVLKATVDLYSATAKRKRVVFAANNLTDGTHTIQIKVLGTHNPSSSGNRVDVDAFEVLNPT